MSERVERHLVSLLGQPHHDPYGNPIPGLDELGVTPAAIEGVESVVDVAGAEPTSARLVRVGEPLQVDVELLAQLEQLGIRPGTDVRLRREDGVVTIAADGAEAELELGSDLAKHLFVAR